MPGALSSGQIIVGAGLVVDGLVDGSGSVRPEVLAALGLLDSELTAA